MDAVFLKIINMSITATWVVLAVLLLRPLLKKAPKRILCIMWALVAVRLIFPFSLESIFSLIPSSETINTAIYPARPYIDTGIGAIDAPVNEYIGSRYFENMTVSADSTEKLLHIFGIIWIIGIILMLLYTTVSYLRLSKKVREATPLRDRILICDHIDTPFILGIFRPRIYLPSAIHDRDTEYVIAHENAHLKRHDHWWKPLGFLLLSIYWFSPALWLAYIVLCRDIEAACDEKVLLEKGEEIKTAYSEALINCSVPRKSIAACPIAFGESGVKERVKHVLNYKKPAFWIIIVSVILCVAAAVCFLTDPISRKSNNLVQDLANQLSTQGIAHTITENAQSQISSDKTWFIAADGENAGITIYQYPSKKRAKAIAENVSSDGCSIAVPNGKETYSLQFNWQYPPHWYIHDKWVICYNGEQDKIITLLTALCGEEFASQRVFTLSTLRNIFPQYFDLDTTKELTVYVWQMAENLYSCALRNNRNNDNELSVPEWLFSAKNAASINEMRVIIDSYGFKPEQVAIVPIRHPISDYYYEIDDNYIAKTEKLFWQSAFDASADKPGPDSSEFVIVSEAAPYLSDGASFISGCIKEHLRNRNLHHAAISIESHITLKKVSGTPPAGKTGARITEYMIVCYEEYSVGDHISPHTATLPVILTYDISENGAYSFVDFRKAESIDSVKSMFPADIVHHALHCSEHEEELKKANEQKVNEYTAHD